MVHKHFIKNAVIFTAMLLIVGVNSAPIMSKAGNDFGVAFSVDGETKFTGSQNNIPLLQFRCHALIKILMVHIIMAKYMLMKTENIMMYHMDMNTILMSTKLIICLTG